MARGSATLSMRMLLTLLLAVVLTVAPSRAYRAEAAGPPAHHDVMDAGHCSEPQSQDGEHEKMPPESCCVSMCQALGIVPHTIFLVEPPERDRPAIATPAAHDVYVGEIATPPPR